MNENLSRLETLLLKYAFGKKNVVRLLMVTLISKGHILIEDLPGVGKTTLAKAFSALLGRTFSRVQGTSDTLPQDITGGEVLDLKTNEVSVKPGPIFKEIVLIDEINRMHPKTQSALMEAMEEKQVSIAGNLFKLPETHMVIATQNPIEYSGTYPLPEAQRDRFFCVLTLGFPSPTIQKEILSTQSFLDINDEIKKYSAVMSQDEIISLQDKARGVKISEDILDRLIKLAEWTRDESFFRYGISPRGLAVFVSAMRANALLEDRDFVIPEDGLELVTPLLSHRVEFLDESMKKNEFDNLLKDKYIEIFKRM
jgi:MoxR-like ATPase